MTVLEVEPRSIGGNARPLVLPAADYGARHFLFVTAPFGPFSKTLAKGLRAHGARCERILLNGGDLIDWGAAHGWAYRDGIEAWPRWIREHIAREGVTDLITHGDSHPYARTAIDTARAMGLSVHVFEQGYLRPHWITLERDGVNANSSLARSAEAYANISSAPTPGAQVSLGRTAPTAVARIVLYHLMSYALWALFSRYRNPYAEPPWRQCAGHIRRYISQRVFRARTLKAIELFMSGGGPCFLVLLQRPGDSQLVHHSKVGPNIAGLISEIVEGFAAHAPKDARLLIKSHPLDQGLEPHGRNTARAAERAGVGDRVLFADDGDFNAMVAKASAVISVNSTGAMAALQAGLPTIALGRAIYDMPGLTHQDGLDSFWTNPASPDANLFRSFRAALLARTQINGAFATREGIDLAMPEAIRRLMAFQAT